MDNLFQIFHQESKKHRFIPEASAWPEEWRTIYYKTYPRLKKIKLERERISFDLIEAIKKRSSRRDFNKKSLTKKELSIMLEYSCGTTGKLIDSGDSKRAQPSAGARFPIEVYPLVLKGNDEIKNGLYHYSVKDHGLTVLWEKDFSDADVSRFFKKATIVNASLVLILTAVFGRACDKYGNRGYRYVLLEAGHIGQNIHLLCEALNLGCFALGGTQDENLEKLIDIDGVTESVIYAMVVGR